MNTNKNIFPLRTRQGIVGQGLSVARAVIGDVKAYMMGVKERGCDIDRTGKTPTGSQRLMHAIMLTRTAHTKTNNGVDANKMPNKKRRMQIINNLLRTQAA